MTIGIWDVRLIKVAQFKPTEMERYEPQRGKVKIKRSLAYVQLGGTLLQTRSNWAFVSRHHGEVDAHSLGLNGGEVNANHIGSGKVICHVYRPSRRKIW